MDQIRQIASQNMPNNINICQQVENVLKILRQSKQVFKKRSNSVFLVKPVKNHAKPRRPCQTAFSHGKPF